MTVGMAMAEHHLAARTTARASPSSTTTSIHVMGDGDLQEGVNHESAALAGHLKLGRLIWFHDDNRMQLDTATNKAESEDTSERYRAYGWEVLRYRTATIWKKSARRSCNANNHITISPR